MAKPPLSQEEIDCLLAEPAGRTIQRGRGTARFCAGTPSELPAAGRGDSPNLRERVRATQLANLRQRTRGVDPRRTRTRRYAEVPLGKRDLQEADSPPDSDEELAWRQWRPRLEQFCRGLAAGLSELLHTRTRVSVRQLQRMPYGRYLLGGDESAGWAALGVGDDRRSLILDIGWELLFPLIERMLGGGLQPAPAERRPLTEIEKRLATRSGATGRR